MTIYENISLRRFNSFGVEARAARLVEWHTPEELVDLYFDGQWLALGGGNNMLFTRDWDGTLVKSAAQNITITSETPETVAVRAEAGVDWDDFVLWCVTRGLWGVENLSGIPGTVGAAPIQNIGAYGAEAGDVIASVECHAVETRSALTLAAEHCSLGYRDSVFKRQLKGRVVVTAVNFRLHKTPRPNLSYAALAEKVGDGATLEDIRRTVVSIRDGKLPDPGVAGNAGSFFKNPIVPTSLADKIAEEHPSMPRYACVRPHETKLAAGWLVEHAGWKGRIEGRVGVHPRQALIIVNLGGATGGEIANFAHKIQNDVKTKFGVELTPEVNVI